MSVFLTIIAAMLLNSSAAKDCGSKLHKDLIDRTQALVVSRHEVDATVGEMPTPAGTPECSRVQFSIGSDGSPTKVLVAESSGNVAVNMAVIRAVKKYKFKKELFSQIRTYTLVFYISDNKIPQHYLDGTSDGNVH